DRELIGEYAVGALHDEVADFAREPLLEPALNPVGESDRIPVYRDPPRARAAAGRDALAAGPRIDPLAAPAERRGFELPARAGAGIRDSLADETVERGLIRFLSFALPADRSVPFEAVRGELRQDPGARTVPAARLVEILDADQPLAAVRARIAIA